MEKDNFRHVPDFVLSVVSEKKQADCSGSPDSACRRIEEGNCPIDPFAVPFLVPCYYSMGGRGGGFFSVGRARQDTRFVAVDFDRSIVKDPVVWSRLSKNAGTEVDHVRPGNISVCEHPID